MKPRTSPAAYVSPSQEPSEWVAEWITGMPIVLLARALYEAFVAPPLRGELLLPARQD